MHIEKRQKKQGIMGIVQNVYTSNTVVIHKLSTSGG